MYVSNLFYSIYLMAKATSGLVSVYDMSRFDVIYFKSFL